LLVVGFEAVKAKLPVASWRFKAGFLVKVLGQPRKESHPLCQVIPLSKKQHPRNPLQ
jgi:hypothetical protein